MDKCKLCGDTIRKNQKASDDTGFPTHEKCITIANNIVSVSREHNMVEREPEFENGFVNYIEPTMLQYLH